MMTNHQSAVKEKLDTWEEHVDAINSQGLKLRVGTSEKVVKVRAASDCRGIGPADLIIVLVKSFNTREAIENAGPIIGEKTVIMSLQNGLGNEEIIGEVVGKEHVVGGRTFAGGSVLAPGHVIASTTGKPTYIGELDGAITQRVEPDGRGIQTSRLVDHREFQYRRDHVG